ncbi:resolvase [Bacillus safensis]|nr:resolvase [Bacillus safensis]
MLILKKDERLSSEEIMNLIGKINGLIYVRVSTADQAEKGYSIESQIEMCKDRAIKKFGYKENELIVLVEPGGMGDDPNRPALNHALHLLEKGLGKKIFVLHPDRLTRDNTLQGIVSRKIWSMGVDIEFIEFEVDPTNPESMLMYNIQGSIAQYNKAKILANSKRGRTAKAKKGEFPSFKRLYGYTFNKETDKPEINEEEKAVLIQMKDMLLYEGMSSNEIAKHLSKIGVPAPEGETWHQASVSRMFNNLDYTGDFYYGKTKVVQVNGEKKQVPRPREEWILIKIPQIWSHETRDMILEALKKNTRNSGRKSNDYLLKNIVKCGRCGGSCGSGITSKTKSGIYKYYSCSNKRRKSYINGLKIINCEGKNWRVDIVDEVLWKWVVKLLRNPEFFVEEFTNKTGTQQKIEQITASIGDNEKRLSQVEQEITNYVLLFGKGKIDEAMFDNLTSSLNERKDQLRQDLILLSNTLESLKETSDKKGKIMKYIKSINKLLESKMETRDKRKVISLLIEKVILNEDDTMQIILKNDSSKKTKPLNGLEMTNKETTSNNPHKNQDLIQTYGGQTARIHSHSCWLLQGNGSFSFFKPRPAIKISNQHQLS